MSKRLGLLIVMMLFVSLMTGCFGSDDSSTPTPAATSSVVITGTIPALSAPAGAPSFAAVPYGTNHEMLVVDGATMTEITGSAVVINGTTYTATVPAGAANVTALVVIRNKATGKVLYSALVGNIPTATQMSSASVTKVTVSGINLNSESTALATIAKDKNIVAPTVPVSSSVTTMSATVKSNIENAVGAATVTAIKDATAAINAVLNNSGVSPTVKDSILNTLGTTLSKVLEAFVTAVKDAAAVVSQEIGATTLTVGGTVISSTTTPTQVEQAVSNVTVVTVASINAVQDIVVGNGTAVTAIPFPTTVTVVMSDSTTATKNVVWSTTSTPAYNATTEGTYTFTGTVDGTTLTASVKVIVGGIQLRVSNPVFSPVGGVTYTSAQSVTITSATSGATIHYTVDGTEPTISSPVYSAAISVAATTTIKALAVKDGMTSSEVITAVYTINIPVTLAISNGRAIKKADGTIAISWNTNIAPTTAKGAKVSIYKAGAMPDVTFTNYVYETNYNVTNHSVVLPVAVQPSGYDTVRISYMISEEEFVNSDITTFEDETLTPILSTVVAVNGNLTLTFTGVAVPAGVAVADFAVKNSINGSTYADVTPSAITRVSDTVVELAVASIAATDVDQVVLYTASYKSGTVVTSGSFTVAKTTTTKVLTGIALAKATDTVEANVAYTLPTAKASYDDNSVPADVTVTWVEVLDGGTTAAVTLPVTKTVAGTYNFTASYTEGGVTKTADFSLVVTEPVPVKTLQSIDVTPATLPDMTVNATKTVGLKVIANYLEGTVASTEEVTAQATVTASAGTYAADVFTAPATAADVTLTVAFGGQSKTITVKVTAEAPKPTTVTVTALSVVEKTTATSEVVVKDQFGATMTTGYALSYVSKNEGVFTVSSTGVVTASTYSATASSATLEVTVTPTTGTAVTGSALVTVTADATKPTIVSVTAPNNKTMLVTFSKAVDSTTATLLKDTANSKVSSYSLFSVSANALYTLSVTTEPRAAGKVRATAQLLSDNKTVRLTLSDTTTDGTVEQSGFVVGGLTNGQYMLYVSNVKDTAATANTIVAQSNYEFKGTTTPDTAPPVLLGAAYDTGLKQLTLSFDKAPTVADVSKISMVNGTVTVQLTGATSAASGLDAVITLTATQATTLGSTIDAAAYALVKTGSVSDGTNLTTADQQKTITVTVRPTIAASSYDEATNKLTVNFTQPINSATITVAKVKAQYSTNAGTSYNDLAALNTTNYTLTQTTAYASTLEFALDQTAIDAFGSQRSTSGVIYRIALQDEAVTNSASKMNDVGSAGGSDYDYATLTYTKETTAPVISSVKYYTADDVNKATSGIEKYTMYIQFDQKLKPSTITNDSKLTLVYYASASATTTTEISLTGTSANIGTAATLITGTTTMADGKTLKVVFTDNTVAEVAGIALNTAYVYVKTGSTIADANSNAVATQTKAITYTNNQQPDPVTANAHSLTQIRLSQAKTHFSATSAIATTNFDVYLSTNINDKKSLKSVELIDTDNDTVYDSIFLTLNTAVTAGTVLKVGHTGLMDSVGNAITASTSTNAPSVTMAADATAPVLQTKEYVANSATSIVAGQKVKLTFNEPVVQKTSSTLYSVYGTGATMANGAKSNILEITIGNSATMVFGTTNLEASAGSFIVDASNVAYDGSAVLIPTPTGAAAPVQTGNITFTDVDNNGILSVGDQMTIPFDVTLMSSVTPVASKITLAVLDASTTYTAAVNGKNVILTFTTVATADKKNVAASYTVTIATSGSNVKSTWGVENAGITTVAPVLDSATLTKPILESATFNATTKQLKVKFSKAVYLATGINTNILAAGEGLFAVPTGYALTMSGSALGTNYWLDTADTTNKTVVFLCDNVGTTVDPGVTTLNIKTGGSTSTKLLDFYGNAPRVKDVAGVVIAEETAAADTTAPTVTGVKFVDVDNNGQVDAVEFTFSEPIKTFGALETDFGWTAGGLLNSVFGTTAAAPTVATWSAGRTKAVIALETNADAGITASATTTIAYTKAGANLITDYAGNPVATFAAMTLADGAAPVMVAGATQASFDSDTDGKVNTVDFIFTEDVAITGTLSATAGVGPFFKTATVNAGNSVVNNLVVTGYTAGAAGTKKLTVTFDDNVVGTGVVNMNIVNGDPSNYLADAAGNKVLAVATPTIADKALPVVVSGTFKDVATIGTLGEITDYVTFTYSEDVTATFTAEPDADKTEFDTLYTLKTKAATPVTLTLAAGTLMTSAKAPNNKYKYTVKTAAFGTVGTIADGIALTAIGTSAKLVDGAANQQATNAALNLTLTAE